MTLENSFLEKNKKIFFFEGGHGWDLVRGWRGGWTNMGVEWGECRGVGPGRGEEKNQKLGHLEPSMAR